MNSIDSKIPRRTECGDHIHDCPQLAEMLDDLREENARLTRELDEARVTKDMHKERAQEAWAEVTRLEGLILDALDPAASGRDEMAKPSIRELLRSLHLDSAEREWLTSLQDDDHMVSIDHKDERVLAGQCLDAAVVAARVERVLTLHEEWDEQPVCRGCGSPWPCPTVRALEGEE